MAIGEENLVETKLTRKIIGIAFEIYNQVGAGYPEKVYQNAFEIKLNDANLKYSKENYCKIELEGKRIGGFRLDFLVENKVIIETKARDEVYKKDISQILTYLKVKNIKVGLLILFAKSGVKIKRYVM